MHEKLKSWKARGEIFAIKPGGHQVFYRSIGADSAPPAATLLLIHGYPESSYSWHKVADGLAAVFQRVVLLDLVGYGLSDKPTAGYGYSLFEQTDAVLQVWRHLGVTGGHLLAHDMGDSVATELIARKVNGTLPGFLADGFRSVTFTNGSMVLGLANLRLMQKLLLTRAGPLLAPLARKRLFVQQVRSAHGPDTLMDDDIDLLWHGNLLQNGHRKNHLTIRYLHDRRRFEATRWLPALAEAGLPIHLCWGEADAVARVAMAHHLKREVCPGATLTLMPGVGHFCQLSDPGIWLGSVTAFYQSL